MHPVMAGWVRTPFHRAHKGELSGIRPDTLVAESIKEVVSRLKLDPSDIDDVIVGCAYPEISVSNERANVQTNERTKERANGPTSD